MILNGQFIKLSNRCMDIGRFAILEIDVVKRST